MKNSTEIWKDVISYKGRYQVSNFGEVSSTARENKIVRKTYIRNGYVITTLTLNYKTKTASVHRLVAEAFIPNPENKPFINHKNGIKTDNRVENLEWCTREENVLHAMENNLYKNAKGSSHFKSKLSESDVIDIFRQNVFGVSIESISEYFSIHFVTVYKVLQRQSWKHVLIPECYLSKLANRQIKSKRKVFNRPTEKLIFNQH